MFPTPKKVFVKIFSALILLCSFFMTGCPNAMQLPPLDEPDMGIDYERSRSYLPTSLAATHGRYREIELSWEPANNAVRYHIYKSATPFDEFVQIGETVSSENTFVVSEHPNVSAYYRVSAVDYMGKESTASNTAHGTTLGTPIITDISDGKIGENEVPVVVSWYMGNSQYYDQGSVVYTVICYTQGGLEVARKTIEDSRATCTPEGFEGLEPNTTYVFEIEVHHITDQGKVEVSGKLDSETARRLRPAAPENVTAAQGEQSEYIEVSFTKPVMVDVLVAGDYQLSPLDFRVYRKEIAPGDYNAALNFDDYIDITSTLDGADSLAYVKPEVENTVGYVEGDKVTVKDKKVTRGTQYAYLVRSFAYKEKEKDRYVTTSNQSVATAVGWPVSKIVYALGREWQVDNPENPTKHVSATLSTETFVFETFGLDDNYTYDLKYSIRYWTGKKYDENENARQDDKFTGYSRADLENYTTNHALPDQKGIYTATLTVHGKSGWSEKIASGHTYILTESLELPYVENFTIYDGFPDKFLFYWEGDPQYDYVVEYKKPSESAYKKVGTVSGADCDNGKYIQEFTHDAEGRPFQSGDEFNFQVTPEGGQASQPLATFYVLSKPDVQFAANEAKMASITVSWAKVEKAQKYKVWYGDNRELAEIEVDGRNNYTHTFEKPDGWNKMAESGKDVVVKVQALNTVEVSNGGINRKYDVDATGEEITRTLGPALTNPSATKASKPKQIDFTWDAIPGAKGYFISRRRFDKNTTNDLNDIKVEIVYYYDVEANTLTVPDAELQVTDTQVVKTGDKFTLQDKFAPAIYDKQNLSYEYYEEQDRLAWGYPFFYQVFPVDSTVASASRDVNHKDHFKMGDTVTYPDANSIHDIGAALGYGWNVTATKGVEKKAEGGKVVHSDGAENTSVAVTWDNPYISNDDKTKVRYSVRRRKETDTTWEYLQDANNIEHGYYLDKNAEPGVVYEYAVGLNLNAGSSNPTTDDLYISESDKKKDEKWQDEKAAAGFILPLTYVTKVSRDGRTDKSGVIAEDVEWSSVLIGRDDTAKVNRMIDGYVIEIYNENTKREWAKVQEMTIGESELNPTPTAGTMFGKMLRDYPSYTTSISRGTASKPANNLEIVKDHRHWYRVRAFTKTDEGTTTYGKEFKPIDINSNWLDKWYAHTDESLGGGEKVAKIGGIAWGTRGLTHEDFKYVACYLLAQGVKKVGWTTTTSWWNSGNGFFSKSTTWVGAWGFAFNKFGEGSFLLADGRLGAETAGSWNKPRYYYTMMGDTNNLSGDDSKAASDIVGSKGVTKKTVWYIGGGGKYDKDTSLGNQPSGVSNKDYNRYSNHGWWGTNSKEMINILQEQSWYADNGIEDKLFDGYIYIYNMPDVDGRQYNRWIDTFMFKGYKMSNNKHTRPASVPTQSTAQNIEYKNRFFQEIPYLPKANNGEGFDPYK